MKSIIYVCCLLSLLNVFGQNKPQKPVVIFDTNKKIEDRNGHLITDSIERKAFFDNQTKQLKLLQKNSSKSTMALPAVPMCTNGSFEEFESVSGKNVLKNYEYTTGEPLNPMQCKSVSESANLRIKQYDPADYGLMASTVPSNFIDEYIGNINAFDQYTLKINYKDSYPTMGLIQTKRYKTDNETIFKFNYKAVLQSIIGTDHDNEQPYFKARIINNSGSVVSEFCLIGNPADCIFTQAPTLEGGSIILYTPNWQSGMLDISSIPNNQEFTVEFMAARCGLNGHFGYAYIDDICLLHSDESLQGSIELDPLYKICPTLPISVCGSFSLPSSGGINANITTIELKVYDENNTVVYSTQTPASLNLATKRFCFDLVAANLPNITTGSYNVSVKINFGIVQTDCLGTSFASATDDDANPGWDIWFLNCSNCDIPLQPTNITLCDTNHDGKEFFNLSSIENTITPPQPGLTFSYYTNLTNATNDTNPITTFTNFESSTTTVYVRATLSPTCYKIIAIKLIVRNPTASISGILNICSGSTVLTASTGASYLWANSLETTQSITVTSIGTYSVAVTDTNGCVANGTVTILNNNVAPLPTIVLTQPTCSSSTGSIHVTSPASEFSYDGGATWGTNPVMSNLPYGSYAVKIKTVMGCISYNSNVNIIPYLSSFPDFSSVSPTSCGGLGSITITSLSDYYSFDDGLTWTTDNVATGLPSGTYLIRTKDAFGCISNFNSVTLNSEFLDPPLYIKDNPFCGAPGSIIITTPAAEYSFDGGNTWQTSNTLGNLSSGSYIIKIKNNQGCTSPNVYVYLNNLENSYPLYNLEDAGCGTYATITIQTPGDFYSFDGGATWTTNPVLTNINGPASFSVIVRKGATCKSYPTNVYVNSQFLPIPNAMNYATTLCDALNDGSENINLTLYHSNLIANPTAYTFTYFNSLTAAQNNASSGLITNFTSCNLSNTNNKVYVRITSTDSCSAVAELKFTFIDSPRIYMDDRYPLCENKFAIIDAGVGFDSYQWSSGQTVHAVAIIHDGNYSVTVTENHPAGLVCSSKKDINVFLSNPATITKIEEFDWTEVDNSIIITVIGLGIYEYSIDGIHYQTSNKFENLKPGIYKVYVRDKYGCGTTDDEALLLNYPKFFTPNNDGFNDYWRIRFSQFEPDIDIKIFDRYGKLLVIMGSDDAWDGTYNGHLMPSDDYWFYVTRSDGKIHKGHFAMKR